MPLFTITTINFSVQNLPPGTRVIRVMPNTPCMVQQGASVYVPGKSATKEDGELTKKLLEAVGTCEEAIESYLDPVTALSGSGPAYVRKKEIILELILIKNKH